MRRKLVAGNWKLHGTRQFATALMDELVAGLPLEGVDLLVLPPLPYLGELIEDYGDRGVAFGAQDVSSNEKGAYTGEVSAAMLVDVGARYGLVGHSERRQYHNEDNALINAKVKILLEKGINPIICVGESLEQREMDLIMELIDYQVKAALCGVDASQLRRCVIAYEPIWAIGTGKTATADQAQEVCEGIRAQIRRMYGARPARAISILYGGSMNAKNCEELLAMPDIDGGLIGGASLKPKEFATIISATVTE